MEERKLNVSFGKTGNGYLTSRLAIPITDLRDMKITPENREIFYHYNENNKIMILSKEDLSDYEIKLIKKNK